MKLKKLKRNWENPESCSLGLSLGTFYVFPMFCYQSLLDCFKFILSSLTVPSKILSPDPFLFHIGVLSSVSSTVCTFCQRLRPGIFSVHSYQLFSGSF